MGLSESKVPFEAHESESTPQNKKEIGICSMTMWDPRSPSEDFERTPVIDRNERVKLRDNDIGVVAGDPRSPSNEITRTPVGDELENSSTDLKIDNELRVQLERLQIYDGGIHYTAGSTENLGNDSESISAVTQQKTVLKLLDDDQPTAPGAIDSFWSPNTPPCPKSRSTPREDIPNSPETPDCRKTETEGLIKKRRASSKKQRNSQKTEKLQKKVLKKAFAEQATRSPLAERNGVAQVAKVKEGKSTNGKAKSTTFVNYRKYNSLDESFGSDSFVGKENEQIVW